LTAQENISFFSRRRAYLALLLCLLALACSTGNHTADPFIPDNDSGTGTDTGDQVTPPVLDLGLRLTVGSVTGQKSPAMLAVARDDTVSDSTGLYLDVEITNLGPEVVYVASETKNLILRTQLSFVDVPWLKQFNRGKLEIVVGQTETGYQATEKLDFSFLSDTTLSFDLPVTRVDTFRVADNVAVYGAVLSEDKYVVADSIKAFYGSTLPSGWGKPALAGYVRSTDVQALRLYVSTATVAIDQNKTRVYDAEGNRTGIEMLADGSNRLTITALAWGYNISGGMIANGWEYRHYDLYVARPFSL